MSIKVTVWNENRHEQTSPEVRALYPEGIHGCISTFLKDAGMDTKTATLEQPEHGLTEQVLADTDVLIWWGHRAHNEVDDEIVNRVHQRVQEGMGLIVLHSGHASKIFRKISGTDSQQLKWRVDGKKEVLWVIDPAHPIAQGLDEKIILEHTEMYGEHFNIKAPDELVFISWFEGGEVFRSGCCYHVSRGKVFYFRPGHETFPIFYDTNVQKVIINAVNWAVPRTPANVVYGKSEPVIG